MSQMNRRDFLKTTAVGAIAAGLAGGSAATEGGIPHRVLGKTGVSVPILGYGTAPTGVRRELKDAIELYNLAIDLGATYMDTAPGFSGYGKSQEYLGHVLKDRRDEVFLVTKCWEPKGDDALRLLEKNLKELQTDRADVVFAHSVGDGRMKPEVVMGKGGVMEALIKAKKDGLTRFIGISGHNRPQRFVDILNNFEIDVMMNAVNFINRYNYDFENKVWPLARAQEVGLVAMKVFGGGSPRAGERITHSRMPEQYLPDAFRYPLSIDGCAVANIGIGTKKELLRNIEWAKSFKPLDPEELAKLELIGKSRVNETDWKEQFGKAI